jgi:hypothetical protein
VVESTSWGKKPRDAAAIMAAAAAGEDITDASSGDAVVRHSMVLPFFSTIDVPVELMFHNVACVTYSIQFILTYIVFIVNRLCLNNFKLSNRTSLVI